MAVEAAVANGYDAAARMLNGQTNGQYEDPYAAQYNAALRGVDQTALAAYRKATSPGGSVAQQQGRQMLGEALQATASQAVGRGANAGNERAALYAGAKQQSEAIGQSAALRAQETQAAQQQLLAAQQWGAVQIAGRADEEYRRRMAEAQLGMEMARLQAGEDSATSATAAQGIGMGASAAMTAASLAMMSDVRNKEAIAVASPDALDETAGSLDGFTFEYKEPLATAMGKRGRKPGIMAQDLESTPLGELAVVETPTGKGIDRDAALGLSLAEIGRLAKRVDQLEGVRRG